MTGSELTAAGFQLFTPGDTKKFAASGYQLRVRDDQGTRYFITVFEYINDTMPPSFEAELYYNDGLHLMPSECAVRITLYSGIEKWTPQQLIDVAAELWGQLCPRYYETY